MKPKNAVAILNEIVKNLSYEVETISNRSDGRTFKASVSYDGIVHEGFGKFPLDFSFFLRLSVVIIFKVGFI